MTEIKAPLNLLIKNFILGHIHLFLVISFIALAVLLSSCNKAKAAEEYLPYGFGEQLQSDINNICPALNYNTCYNTFAQYMRQDSQIARFCDSTSSVCVKYIMFVFNNGVFNNSDVSQYTNTYNITNINFTYSSSSSYYMVYGYEGYHSQNAVFAVYLEMWNTGTYYLYTIGLSHGIDFYSDNRSICDYDYNSKTFGSTSNILRFYNGWNNSPTYILSNWAGYSSNLTSYIYDIQVYNGFCFQFSGNNYGLFNYPDNWETYHPSAVEDSRLRFYKSSTTYGDTLNIDISQFISDFPIEIPHQADASLSPREITLYIYVDGTERLYVCDPSSSLWSNNNSLCQVPYQWFIDADIYSSNATSVTITKCEFTLAASNDNYQTVSYDYNIACNYNLVGQSNIIEPGVVPNPTYNNTDIVSSSEITNITNYFNNASSSVANGTWQFVTSVPSLPSWAVTFETSLDYTTQDSLSFPNRFYNHPYGLGNLQVDLSDWLENSVYRFNDVIIIDIYSGTWGNDPVVPPTFTFSGYLVFYTDRYYLRQDAFNQLSILEVLQADAENAVSYYHTVKSKLDDFENKSIDGFNEIIGIGNTSNGWFVSIDGKLSSGFTSVVDAINNIDFDFPSFDDTDILDKLDDIITAISNIGTNENEIDTPQECIDFYIDNIDKDINDIEFELRPAYYEGMTLYILYNFDIDDNYSDDVQRASIRGSKANNPITDSENILVKVIITLRDTFTSSDAHNVINSTLKDMNGRSNYYTQLFDSDYDCQEWEGFSYD